MVVRAGVSSNALAESRFVLAYMKSITIGRTPHMKIDAEATTWMTFFDSIKSPLASIAKNHVIGKRSNIRP